MDTVNLLNSQTTQNVCCNLSKIWTMWLYHRVMSPNDADGMANSADPDQTAPLGAVWSGSVLFAQAYLSKNLGSLQYILSKSSNWPLSFNMMIFLQSHKQSQESVCITR